MDKITREILETLNGLPRREQQSDAPPVIFEQKTGLNGLSQHYELPEGVSAADLETYALLMRHGRGRSKEKQLEKLTAVVELLADLNPVLKKIKYDASDPNAAVDIIRGVASKFNVRDIQHFVPSLGSNWGQMSETQAYKKLSKTFSAYAAHPSSPEGLSPRLHLGWVPAPETIAQIQKQILKKIDPPAPRLSKRS